MMRGKTKNVLLCIVIISAIALMLVSCKNAPYNPDSGPELSEYAYIAEFVPIAHDVGNLWNHQIAGETLYFTANSTSYGILEYNGKELDVAEYHSDIYTMNTDGTGLTKLGHTPAMTAPADTFGYNIIRAMHIENDGNIYVAEDWEYWRYNIPVGHNEEISEAWELYEFMVTVEKGSAIRKLDAAGTGILSIDVSSVSEQHDGLYIDALYVDIMQNIYLAVANVDSDVESIYLIDHADGSINEIESGFNTDRFIQLPDGQVAFPINAPGEDGNYLDFLQVIDYPGRKLGDRIYVPVEGQVEFFTGSGIYDLFVVNYLSLYGYVLGEDELIKLLDWEECDIVRQGLKSISGFITAADERLLCIKYDIYYSDVVILTRMLRSEIPEKTVITFGSVGYGLSHNTRMHISQFNRTNPDYKIEIIDYSEFNTDNTYFDGLERFAIDITNGNIPDIIDVSFLPYKEYAERGLFADLYPFLDADPDYNRSDFVEGVFEITEIDGCLYQVFPAFEIYTLLGSADVLGSDIGWDIEEFAAVLTAHPEADIPLGTSITKSQFLFYTVDSGLNSYIDWSAGTVHFYCDEFIRLLEIADTFPADIEWYNQIDDYEAIRAGRMIMSFYPIRGFSDYQFLNEMFNGSFVFKGFPTISGGNSVLHINEGLAISNSSAHKETAWAFIRSLLDADTQMRYDRFPTNQLAFQQQAYDVTTITETDVRQLMTLLASTSMRVYDSSDEIIWNIVNEDASDFFNGIISSQEAARRIQNRVSVLVSERS